MKTSGAPRIAVLDSKLVDFWGGPGDDAYISGFGAVFLESSERTRG